MIILLVAIIGIILLISIGNTSRTSSTGFMQRISFFSLYIIVGVALCSVSVVFENTIISNLLLVGGILILVLIIIDLLLPLESTLYKIKSVKEKVRVGYKQRRRYTLELETDKGRLVLTTLTGNYGKIREAAKKKSTVRVSKSKIFRITIDVEAA